MHSNELAIDFDERRIDEIFAVFNQCHLPGAAVGIAIDGTPIYRKGFGLASMELPVILSPSMRMRIGSTTKHFTAFAYLRLCEEGKAALDDPLRKYLPGLHPVTHGVTMRQLMANTSGLRDACDVRFQFSGTEGRAVTSADLLTLYRDMDDVNANPGTHWIYNNGGWVLLSAAIERIANQPLEDVFRTEIFEPLGMHATMLRRWDTDFVANSATAHAVNRDGRFERLYWDMDFAGAGAIVSTADDMLRWLAHMDAPRIGSPATWAAMKTPQRLLNGSHTGYGLGLVIGEYRGLEILHHAGGWTGGNAQMLKVPRAGLDIVVILNRGDASAMQLVESILDACLPASQGRRAQIGRPIATGTFRSPRSGRIIQLFATNGQQIVSLDGRDTPVQPDAAGVLWPAGESVHLKRSATLIGDAVRPAAVCLNDFGNIDELIAVAPDQNADTTVISGRYRSDSTGTDATVGMVGDDVRLSTAGRFGSADFSLECLMRDVWRARALGMATPSGAIVTFDGDGTAFSFTNSLTRSLRLRRLR